ncbi:MULTISPECIES: alpha-D-ribose 1-methylphosphonate 5-triphosphate diphosphatase [Acidithiobacillus]|jgi:alpha-D-ribose 1-methylphosphonate 5-triphosphate diphosphatase|uniref:Phosphonate metabolism protein PhnM n=1 Tax=Acidithiobacillus thiooxidans TaxID=930 RepID=A0A1C2I0X9_ACITH|nr:MULTISPECIES: alpha-D-ribose 1-methylphosphonate 5-triphosphate diphosphatase [Acidithiobacillus]MBE7567203.1 alpha-D-ribose 1-methylphosphonate 5-triphosphate diphosphatase [Acidithiobacillus sp. HP-11]MBU2750929.1 alpha-D-ribose 1-methylphosphonate 5-triphosphate diphosphatase [Acidithiobacillus thiooxidans]MBU2794991.1 alpha-D-ribose 1-methylphosphonate 5-triphosphate diphosphatase [Acidithiobacillus thiooxidans]MBU2834306.1 alpha-D-ribose 1-methylphosphonate 5-triphosphate diphosphatase 
MKTLTFSNFRMVLEYRIVHGALTLDENGKIIALEEDPHPRPGSEDGQGDWLLPGLVDVHTDNLERQVQPRSNVRWPSRSAFLAHDSQCAAAGITTVADALCVGDAGFESQRIQTLRDAVVDLTFLNEQGLLRSDHVLHLRCELPTPNMQQLFETAMAQAPVHMISIMDHTPGVGQHANLDKFREGRRGDGYSEAELDQMIVEAQQRREIHSEINRHYLLEKLHGMGLQIASHDDRTAEEVRRNAAEGIRIAEFPVTLAAAQEARKLGMATVAGAPNVVRGGSHSGNVAVRDLVAAGLVDVLASDYVPHAMLEAAFALTRMGLIKLPEAVQMVSLAPARMLGLEDRGALQIGMRGDLLRVRDFDNHPLLRAAWKAGERIA